MIASPFLPFLLQCLVSTVDGGLRSGGGIGEALGDADAAANGHWARHMCGY
jgi:hypothetical protein